MTVPFHNASIGVPFTFITVAMGAKNGHLQALRRQSHKGFDDVETTGCERDKLQAGFKLIV